MAGFERVRVLAQPPEAVFDLLTDLDQATRLVTGLVSVERLGAGPLRSGARFRQVRRVMGDEVELELEVMRCERPHRFAFGGEKDGVRAEYDFTLAPEGTGTRVALSCEVRAGGLKKMMLPMIVGVLEREDGDYLERLAAALA